MKGNGIQGPWQQERWCFPWWIENDLLCSFENSKFGIQYPKIIEIMITMMITRCHPIVNDKRPPIATTFMEMLCIIV
jgi:hypothetical protein